MTLLQHLDAEVTKLAPAAGEVIVLRLTEAAHLSKHAAEAIQAQLQAVLPQGVRAAVLPAGWDIDSIPACVFSHRWYGVSCTVCDRSAVLDGAEWASTPAAALAGISKLTDWLVVGDGAIVMCDACLRGTA